MFPALLVLLLMIGLIGKMVIDHQKFKKTIESEKKSLDVTEDFYHNDDVDTQ